MEANQPSNNFRLEDYLHLSAKEIRQLPKELRDKIMVASAEIAAIDYKVIEDDQEVIEY